MKRAVILALLAMGAIDEDDVPLLLRLLRPSAPLSLGAKFDLTTTSDADCIFLFRFTKEEIAVIASFLPLPERVRVSNGSVFDKTTALCVMLRRFTSPARLGDLMKVFGRQRSELSMVFNAMVRVVWAAFGGVLKMSRCTMPEARLKLLADAVTARGAPLSVCVGFVDGTVRGLAKPGENQREVYNGHKRKHALKFQAVMAADGMFCDAFGPCSGRRHDMYLFHRSNLLDRLQRTLVTNGTIYCVYGDPAYILRPVLQVGFKGCKLSEAQADFNEAMSSVRVTVEWGFANVTNLWSFLDVKRSLRIGLSPVGMYYLVGLLLTNLHNSVRPNEISTFFSVPPLGLVEYLELATHNNNSDQYN